MALSKKARATLRDKFDGKCAYCGEPLGERWHADHIQNVERVMVFIPGKGLACTGQMHHPERDTVENMNPACAPCNLDKHSMTLEAWRQIIAGSNAVLRRDVSTFRRALRYGLVSLTDKPVTFYFETVRTPKETGADLSGAERKSNG